MSENDYICIPSSPILTYLRSSLKTSLRKLPNSKAIQKMTSLRSGVKVSFMKKLSLYIILGLMWCKGGFADTISDYEMAGAKLKISILEIMTVDQVGENVIGIDSYDPKYFRIKYVPDASKYQNLDFDEYYVTVDSSDEIYPIVSVTAIKWFKTDFDACIKDKENFGKSSSDICSFNIFL